MWYEPPEIEQIMEDELRRAGLSPPDDTPAVNVEGFIEDHLQATLDQYATLEPTVLGLTDFRAGSAPVVRINRDLTGSAMDNEWCPPGVKGRWRATLAHEASHIVLHRILVEGDPAQVRLFDQEGAASILFRCLKRDVSYQPGGRDWREVQANRGMAALLMPRTLFLRMAEQEIGGGVGGFDRATRQLAARFGVSREAATIRLRTMGF
jgi:hypothetical protein